MYFQSGAGVQHSAALLHKKICSCSRAYTISLFWWKHSCLYDCVVHQERNFSVQRVILSFCLMQGMGMVVETIKK